MQRTWQDKTNRLIAEMCMASYLAANGLPDGRMRKRHVPYLVPMRAKQLVECLDTGNEQQAKSLFMLFLDRPGAMED